MLHRTFHLAVTVTLTLVFDTAPLAVKGGPARVTAAQEVAVSTLARHKEGRLTGVDGLCCAVPASGAVALTVVTPVAFLQTKV